MAKVAAKAKKANKAKIKISLDGDLLTWIDEIVSARDRGGKDGRSTVINDGLRWLKRKSHKHLTAK
jgi:metal-responsive CopG/Arc/MetJ family transcriptional regulator